MPRLERLARDAFSGLGIGGHLAGNAVRPGDALELAEPRRQGFVEQVAPVDMQHVEEPRMQQHLARDVGAESRHGVLEGPRPAVLIERERLAVEDHVGHRQAARDLDDLGHAVRDIGEVASEHPHLVARPVHLDARAVELVLDRRLADLLDRRGRGRGGCREHRLHGPAHDEPDRLELARRAGEGEPRGLAEVAREHRRTAHDLTGSVGGPRDRVGHDALERARAHLAEEHPRDEVLFAPGRSRAEVAQRGGSGGRRAGTGCRGELVERGVEVGDRQGRGIRRLAHRPGEAAPPDADPPLSGLAHEEPDRGRDLVGLETAEHLGERVDLRQARPGGGDAFRGRDELIEQHALILAPPADTRTGLRRALEETRHAARARAPTACRVPARSGTPTPRASEHDPPGGEADHAHDGGRHGEREDDRLARAQHPSPLLASCEQEQDRRGRLHDE